MKKTIIFTVLLMLIFALSSCRYGESTPPDGDSQTQQTDTPETSPPLIHGIELAEYPNPYAVSAYADLTDDQKVAYDALATALKDILENGPVPDKSYTLSKRVRWFDYATAYNLFRANFTAVDDVVSWLLYKDSLGTQGHVDSVYLYNGDNRIDEYYQKYLEIVAKADQILSTIDHDGTEYGKALAIAKWMVDNIVYPPDYEERIADGLGGAYSAIIKKEAICGGYAQAFDFLCKKAGLESIYVTGNTTSGEGHAWNMICINDKWYHVDVTWMDSDFYENFMMPDEICFSNRHLDAVYYMNQEENKKILPKADSYDLYKYFYASVDDLLEYYKNYAGISEGGFYYAVLPYVSQEEVLSLHGGEITSNIDWQTYYIDISAGPLFYYLQFIRKFPTLSADESGIKGGFRRVEYSYDAVIYNFEWGNEKDISDLRITIDIPDYLSKADDGSNCSGYLRYDSDLVMYLPAFEFRTAFQVDDGFVMDKTVHLKTETEGTWNPFTDREIITGRTKFGCDYVIYEDKKDKEYWADVYVRVSDKYIISLRYRDLIENYDYMRQSMDSIEIK